MDTSLLDAVKARLDAGQFKEALELPDDNRYAAALKDNCWDLVPHLLERILPDTIVTWPAMQRCCERLLLTVAERANPEEALLELIERAETAENEARFVATLKPLQTALLRASRPGRSLEWCLNTLHHYVGDLPPPENLDLDERESPLMDCDENARRILKVYAELPTFYDHFVDQIVRNKNASSIKNNVVCFLVDLLGKPFAILNMESDGKTTGQARVLAESIFKTLCSIQDDLFAFIPYVQVKCHPPIKNDRDGVYEDAPEDVFLLPEKLAPLSMGVLYYLLLAEKIAAPLLPQIYNPLYIYQEVLCLAAVMVKQDEPLIIYKGLKLAEAILKFVPEQAPHSVISTESNVFIKTLASIAVYCPSEMVRKKTVVLIKDYILKFDDRGRYFIITKLYPSLEHAGIKGYIVNIYKDILLDAYQGEEARLTWFKDKYLQNALQMFCTLKDDAETDLVESADHIISTLNLLRFLTMKDSPNRTGIRNLYGAIESGFLDTLRKAIDMSRAHYEMKLMDLSSGNRNRMPEMSVQVGGSLLDNMPAQNKSVVINAGLNALHLIDSLLSRLQECTSNS